MKMFYRLILSSLLSLTLLEAKKLDDDFVLTEFIFGISKLNFDAVGDRFEIDVAKITSYSTSSGYLTDSLYRIDQRDGSHTMGKFGFNMLHFAEKGLVGKYNFDLRLDSDFEFFQFRADAFWGYNFWHFIGDFSLLGGTSFSYLGNTFSLFSRPSYSDSVGAQDQLYLLYPKISDAANPNNDPYMFTFGPYLLSFMGAINFIMPVFSFGILELTYAFTLVDISFSAESVINTDSSSGFAVPSRGFSQNGVQRPAFLELKFSFNYDNEDENKMLVFGYRVQRHVAIGLVETTIYGGFQFVN